MIASFVKTARMGTLMMQDRQKIFRSKLLQNNDDTGIVLVEILDVLYIRQTPMYLVIPLVDVGTLLRFQLVEILGVKNRKQPLVNLRPSS